MQKKEAYTMNTKRSKLFKIFTVIAMITLTACDPISWPWLSRVEKAQVEATIAADAANATAIVAALTPGTVITTPGAPVVPPAASTPGSVDARALRLLSADANYRSQGVAAWARQLGYSFESISQEARQPEEETFREENGDAMTVVSGVQVRVTNLRAHSPSCFTTDQKVNGLARFVKPDNFDPITNPSVVYTDNEVGFSGTATLWGDCSNWRNLMEAPLMTFAYPNSAPAATAMPAYTTLTMADLASLGEVQQRLYYPEGTLAGAQITFSSDWTAPSGWTIQKNGSAVSSVSAGDTASVWSPENMRPLPEN
ncbi:hypothetical protein HY411_00630 [Candidatus Gottesmanbacteria bacterium]|nr:hypothetical protein [Candidatus Gottesmanbacteria bacterium]